VVNYGHRITNMAGVDAYTDDPDPSNNDVNATSFVQEEADLKVTKFVKPDTTVLAGESIIYTIIVENLGPSPAYGVGIRDEIISSGEFDVIEVISDRLSMPPDPHGHPLGPGHWIIELYLEEPFLEPKGADDPLYTADAGSFRLN